LGAVGLDRDLESFDRLERRDQRIVDLEQRLPTGHHDEATVGFAPYLGRLRSKAWRHRHSARHCRRSMPTKSVSQNWQTAWARSCSRPSTDCIRRSA
jgi:hypothetical protein